MQLCILHIGFASTDINRRHLPSPQRFHKLLKPFLPGVVWTTINCLEDALPTEVDAYDGYLITGGKYSVFEDLDWQYNLFDFIKSLFNASKPLVGICYGHQAIAHALGGQVDRSDKGWGVGVKQTSIVDQPSWIGHPLKVIDLLSMHQDQVIQMPMDAKCFLSDQFCRFAGYYIDNRVLAIQQHPEFTPELCRDLIVGRKERIGGRYESALKSLTTKHQGKIAGQWIANFFKAGLSVSD
jgi:GMP synthase (glutamine-hydrolysing)